MIVYYVSHFYLFNINKIYYRSRRVSPTEGV